MKMRKHDVASETSDSLPPYIFESRDVVHLVGIPAPYLNRFIERRSFGIGPSLRPGRGRGSRRLFATNDVFGIAFVWWLFRAGLRSRVIGKVLKNLSRTNIPDSTNPAAEIAAYLLSEHWASDYSGVMVIRLLLQQGKR